MKRPWIISSVLAIFAIVLVCCLCLAALIGVGALFFVNTSSSSQFQVQPPTPAVTYITATPIPRATSTPRPTRSPTSTEPPQSTPQSTPQPNPTPSTAPIAASNPEETLKTLSEMVVSINDPLDLARRLEGKTGISPTLEPPTSTLQVGDRKSFWVSNTDTNENFQVDATLRYLTDHAYFWIENDVDYSTADLRRLAQTFESKIYPTDREFFGSEWSPGVDGDVHLYILYAKGLGSRIAGYFSSVDSLNPAIQQYSNGHEMFVFNADGTQLNDQYTYGVLAHEFQHMIHWYRDRNEETWMNEGFSDLAMFLNGYDVGGSDRVFAQDPDLQLNDWPNDPSQTVPHYGAAYLFLNYFLDRFGEDTTKALIAEPENGLISIDKVLSDLKVTDPLSGKTVGADDVFMDWELTSYIHDGRVGDGRFTYRKYTQAPRPSATENVSNCQGDSQERQVSQYGADYISIRCRGAVTLHFEGDTQVGVIPENAYSGAYAFWSNKGDESDMTLTHEFDFTNQSGPLTLQYWMWYDIEKDFDYVYLEASTDGQQWELLHTTSGTDTNPTGANYGWGYTGTSGNGPAWVREEVDLSKFAGQKVQIRFEYITDAAVNGEGFLLDDVSVPEINYSTNFESDDGGWKQDGFVRIQNALPQTFRLALIRSGRQTTVEYIPLSSDNVADIPLSFGSEMNEAVLVVTGTTRFTRQPSTYHFSFKP